MLGSEDERLQARLMTRLACAWRSTPDRRDDSDRLSAEALDIARRLDDRGLLVHGLVGRFWATFWPENPEERVAIGDANREYVQRYASSAGVSDLAMLAELHDRGKLTDDEFAAEKARLLGTSTPVPA